METTMNASRGSRGDHRDYSMAPDGLAPTQQAVISATAEALHRGVPGAVIVSGEPGTGKTHLIKTVTAQLRDDVRFVAITPGESLRHIPYGALLQCLRHLTPEEAQDRVGILRALWAELHGAEPHDGGGPERPIVIVLDDAHHLDDDSAGVLAEAVASSWIRVLATASSSAGLPGDLLDLWRDGLAERFDLGPLSLEESREAAGKRLGGRLSITAAAVLHALSAGNPLHLVRLTEEATAAGTLVQRRGIWLLTGDFASRGQALGAPVRSAMESLAAAEREALTLIALTEPLPRAAARTLIERAVFDRLTDAGWLADAGHASVRLRYPLVADAIRAMTTSTRRLHLLRRATAVGGDELRQPSNELRLFELALETGTIPPFHELARGAAHAVSRFRNDLGLKAAALVEGEAERSLMRAIPARAHLNLGDPAAALADLSRGPVDPNDLDDVLAGTLIGFAARAARGETSAMDDDAARLERAAEAIERGTPTGDIVFGPGPRSVVMRRARLLRALAADERGDIAAVEAAVADERRAVHATPPAPIEQALWTLLEGSVLLAQGQYATSARMAGSVLAQIEIDDEHFPLEEYGLVRYLSALVLGGDWASVVKVSEGYTGVRSRPIVAFGPGLYCARAFALLHSDRGEEAVPILGDVVENLELMDPLRLLAVAASFAAWAAAAAGDEEGAREYLARAEGCAEVGSAAMRELAAMHRAGAAEILEPGAGLAALAEIAERNRAAGRPGWELIAWVLYLELGGRDEAGRAAEVAAAAEGSWAKGWGAWARAEAEEHGDAYLAAADHFRALGLNRRARGAYARAAACFDAAGDRIAARRAGAAARACEGLPGAGEAGEAEEAVLASLRLSPREQDVVDLAVEGLSDRQIADRLHLSVRTVEGHLHRSYAKLGIRSREDLRAAVED
ncbi:AAA family ATPase [Sinomonas sp. RB5]